MWRLRAPLLALLLMQVILLASSGVTATKKPLGKQETCNMKNHMIEYLRNNGVQIYERPQISSDACRGEWSEFGACCAISSLKKFLESKFLNNQLSLVNQIQEIQNAPQKLTEFSGKYLTNEPTGGLLWAIGSESEAVGNTTADKESFEARPINPSFSPASRVKGSPPLQGPPGLPVKPQLDQILERLRSAQSERIQLQEKCVSKINSVISTIACPVCSGRADDFFEGDTQQLKVSPSLLAVVLADCKPAWTSLVEFQRDVQNYTDLVLSTSEYSCNSGNQCLESESIIMQVSNFIEKRNLIRRLSAITPRTSPTLEFEHVAALCEQFIHIQEAVYSSKIEDDTRAAIDSLSTIQMSANNKRKEYETYNTTLSQQNVFSAQIPFLERLGRVRNALGDMSKTAAVLRSQWSLLQNIRSLVLYVSGTSSGIDPAQLSQTDANVVQIQSDLEDFLAQHEVTKWRTLKPFLTEVALAKLRTIWTTELATVWELETLVIENWMQQTRTTAESEVLAAVKLRAKMFYEERQMCLKKSERIVSRLLWRKVITKAHKSLKGENAILDVDTLIRETLSPIPVGLIAANGECAGRFNEFAHGSGEGIETGGVIRDPQCNPCVNPDPNPGSGLWGASGP